MTTPRKLRAQYLPPAGNALTGLLQGARVMADRRGAAKRQTRGKYYPELFRLLRGKQQVPDIACATLAGFAPRQCATRLTGLSTSSTQPALASLPRSRRNQPAGSGGTTLALSVIALALFVKQPGVAGQIVLERCENC